MLTIWRRLYSLSELREHDKILGFLMVCFERKKFIDLNEEIQHVESMEQLKRTLKRHQTYYPPARKQRKKKTK